MTPAKAIAKNLDVAVLEAMVEPLMVQVSRIKGTAHTPIPLPVGEAGGLPGAGWSKGEVVELSSGWLPREWCGGGNYQITVTDSSQPPQTFTWQSWWPTSSPEYGPERAPGSPQLALVPPSQPTQPQQQPQVNMPQFPNGLPTLPPGMFAPPAPTYAQPSYYQPQGYYQPPSTPYYGNASAGNAADAERRRAEDRLAQVEAQLRQAQLDAQQRAFDATLERERSAHTQQLQRLEQKIAELATTRVQPTGPTPEVEALKEQNRALTMRLDAEAREREMERRERETRDQIAMLKQGLDQQVAAQRENMAQLLAAQNNNKSDPMLQIMLEQSRNSIAAMERIAGQSNAAIEKMQANMLSPRDIMTITREASASGDQITQKMSTAYTAVLDMQNKVLENAINAQPAGSPVVELVREGVNGVKEMAERYVTTTNRMKQVEAQSNAQVESARSQAQAIQAQAQAAIANANARAAYGQGPALPQPPGQQPGLAGPQNGNGKPSNTNTYEEWKRQREQAEQANVAAPPRETASVAPSPTPNAPPTHHGRTDAQWFGPALAEVIATRQAVNELLAELKKPNPQIAEDAATPANVAKGVSTASMVVQAQNLPIPAMTELLFQGKYEEFAAVLLPNVNEHYHKDLANEIRKLNGEEIAEEVAPGEDDDEDPDNEHEDGSPADDVQDGSATQEAAPPPKKQTIRVINPARA
jgi:hypothetical protein